MSKLLDFLRESNAIEGVYGAESLQEAIKAWTYMANHDAMTLGVILKTHQLLMSTKLPEHEAGAWRKIPVWVGSHEGISWSQIPAAMSQWLDEYNHLRALGITDEQGWLGTHITFEKIHPFVDGNGRLGRMLLNWYRVKTGQDIYVIYDETKQDYYRWFQ